MSDTARDVALAYYEAWTSKDLDRAMTYIDDAVVCDAPGGRIEGADAYRAFLAGYLAILEGAELFAAFGDDSTAMLMYDTRTRPVASAPAAEYVTVDDGKIIRSRLIFDRVPFAAPSAAASA